VRSWPFQGIPGVSSPEQAKHERLLNPKFQGCFVLPDNAFSDMRFLSGLKATFDIGIVLPSAVIKTLKFINLSLLPTVGRKVYKAAQIHVTVQMKSGANQYERFGEVIRYLTIEELKLFFDSIDNYHHKLMFEIIYELGCRVGEFVKIQVKHVNFSRSAIFFPAQNTK
jgi:hypothetical protein